MQFVEWRTAIGWFTPHIPHPPHRPNHRRSNGLLPMQFSLTRSKCSKYRRYYLQDSALLSWSLPRSSVNEYGKYRYFITANAVNHDRYVAIVIGIKFKARLVTNDRMICNELVQQAELQLWDLWVHWSVNSFSRSEQDYNGQRESASKQSLC